MRLGTRRAFLASVSAAGLYAASEKGRVLPAEGVRYADPLTDFPVERLTNPEFTSVLPYPYARSISKKGTFFLFSSDRGEGLQAFRYELKTGEIRQLTEAEGLHVGTLNLLPDDKTFAYMDGRALKVAVVGGLKEREVYRTPEDWEVGDGFSVAGDGIFAALMEKQGGKTRLQLIGMARGNAVTLAEVEGELRHPQCRPRRASVLYQKNNELWLVNYDGQNNQKVSEIAASPGCAVWNPDGRTVIYLQPKGNGTVLREVAPDTQQDKLVAATSQFGNFARNADGSVLVAASRSVAQPYVLVMVRAVRRELTVCEHKASDPRMVCPIFSPTSQRIYFGSDRHGKAAIYSVVLAGFLEKTDDTG